MVISILARANVLCFFDDEAGIASPYQRVLCIAGAVHVRLHGLVVQIETSHRVMEQREHSALEVQHPVGLGFGGAELSDSAVMK